MPSLLDQMGSQGISQSGVVPQGQPGMDPMQYLLSLLSSNPQVAMQVLNGIQSGSGLMMNDPSAMRNLGMRTVGKMGAFYGQPFMDVYNRQQTQGPSMISSLLRQMR